ncbi:hypothetical protein SGL43_06949 [Streptomyces globisporus]|uniref:Uncharacterized protein n=1 Tax=Streptomyces globisporus TaxID=1908 RepID=A0ABM9H8B5_STRGL|nr:hypothetical protein SGL43_06949 [Streptomyces globisporus]
MTHGRVAGRNFELRLSHMPGDPETPGLLRIEVTDTRPRAFADGLHPRRASPVAPAGRSARDARQAPAEAGA